MTKDMAVHLKTSAPLTPRPGHYTFATIPFEHRDCENWPQAKTPTRVEIKQRFPNLSDEQTQTLAAEISSRFDRLSRAIREYFASGSLKRALSEACCTKEVFYRQLNRCLMPSSQNGQGIVGWAGLISGLRLKGYTRVNEGVGTAGQFQKWITENDDWRQLLHRMIVKGNGGKKIAGRKPTSRGVTKNFIAQFTSVAPGSANVPLGTYPHNGKSNARRAIERYIESYVATHAECTSVWFGEDIAKRQHLGTGPQSFNLAAGPLDVLGTDAHTTDAIGIIILPGPAGPQRVPVNRIQIVATVCQNTKAVTGYSVCIRSQISASHVEDAYLMGTTPWIPKTLTIEGLSYDKDAGFPCGSVDGISEVNPASIRLDNAAQHYAIDIRTRLRRSLGCAVIWGGVGHWWRNAITERFFGSLERYGFQRLPSSMGAGPNDLHRAKNPALQARGNGIEWHELIQIIDVLLANYNAKPHTSLGGSSPLESLRSAISGRRACWIPRIRPPHTANSPRIGVMIERKKIAGSVEKRIPPYVEVDEVRYTGTCLSTRYDWLGRHVYVHIPKDMRKIEVFLDSGEFIGEIHCMDKGWALSPHSQQVRKAINSFIRKGELWVPSGGDPIVAFNESLVSKASASIAKQGTTKVNDAGSAAADFQLATGISPTPPPTNREAANKPRFTTRAIPGITLPTVWK